MEYIDYGYQKYHDKIAEKFNYFATIAKFQDVTKPHNQDYLSVNYFKTVHESLNSLNESAEIVLPVDKLIRSLLICSVQIDNKVLSAFPVSVISISN